MHSETSAIEIISLLSQRYPQITFPDEYTAFLEAQETSGHQIRHKTNGKTLYELIIAENIPAVYFQSWLSSDSKLISRIDYQALMSLEPDNVLTYLLDHLSYILDLQQVTLDNETYTGFNRHGQEHVRTVARNALSMLQDLYPFHEQNISLRKETIIGGLLHDIGNLLSRKYHGLYGIYLLTQLFENFAADELTLESFLNVLEIVLFHEVEFGSTLPTLTLLRPSTLAVIIADKTDISFRRVSSKSNVPEAIQDAHVLVNLLVASSSVERRPHANGRFCWQVDFRAKFDTSQFNVFSSLLKATGRVKYPKEWEMLYEEGNIEYLFVFNSTFLKVYLSRIYFTVRALFALYASVEEFQLVINDEERGISLIRSFKRLDYQEKIALLGKLFYRPNWQDTYLYLALQQQSESV